MSLACDDGADPSPRIFQVLPDRARVGEPVHILGEKFCGPDPKDVDPGGHCKVSVDLLVHLSGLDGFRPTRNDLLTFWDPELIETQLPGAAPTGVTRLVIMVRGRQSNAVNFEVRE